MEPLFESTYASIEDLGGDTPEVAKMIQDHGLPLDTLWLIDGRLVLLTQIDDEEGRAAPLVRRFYGWPAIRCIMPEYRDGRQHETQNFVVGRDGIQRFWSSKKWSHDAIGH
jgi:hypothetical protein